jgi:Kef-type K+ transport system membrane component KefB
MTNVQLALQFFVQVAVILAFCQIIGVIAKRFGQPQVVAEMLAGVLLGPSVFGLFWPQGSASLFPPDSMNVLYAVSQFGLAAYMFVVGLEFRVDIVRRRYHSAMAVSIAGMVTPFIFGGALGWWFYHHTTLFPATTSLLNTILFLGASMCITAFPVLARIIHFKKLTGTTMGTGAGHHGCRHYANGMSPF